MDSPTRQLEGGVSEKDYALEEVQSRTRETYLGDSFTTRTPMPAPRRRARRRGTMMSERQSLRGWKDTTDESASVSDDDDDQVKRLHITPPATTSEYHGFIHASKALEKTLDELTHTVQRLGSALVLSRACRDVRNELGNVRKFFENTATRFLGVLADNIKKRKKLKHTKRKNRPRERKDSTSVDDVDQTYQNEISDALDNLHAALEMFLTAIRDFEDYSDRDGEESLENFMEQVGVLSGCLSYFGGDGDSHEFPRFIYEKTVAMKEHLEEMNEALGRFVEIGVPCISFAQKRSAKMLLNAATVATFFAGVAATVLQFSIEMNETPVQVAANTLWFASLVLSIGSAINGLLAMTWRQSVFSSPKRQQPFFIRFWTRQGYLVLLVISVLTFLGGLLCYMFETQRRVAFWISAGCTAFCSIGLANVAVWFGIERWDFSKFRKTIHPVISEDPEEPSTSQDIRDYMKVQWFRLRVTIARFGRSQSLPTVSHSSQENILDRESSPRPIYSARERFRSLLFMIRDIPSQFREYYRERRRRPSETQTVGDTAPSGKTGNSVRHGYNQRSQSDLMTRAASQDAINSKQLDEFIENVRDLREKQRGVHQNGARVKHMQFSPCGKWLVVCYQFSCIVYRVGARLEYYQQLRHTRRSAKQVEWAPDGKRLLTRLKDSVRYWGLNENQEFKVIDTMYLVHKLKWILWLNNDEFLALTEDNYIGKVLLKTFKLIMRELPRDLTFHEVYLMDKEDIVLFIATHYFDESKETYIDCIIVYDMNMKSDKSYDRSIQPYGSLESLDIVWDDSMSGRVERKIPLLHDVESLTVCDDLEHVVVSYEENSPEIWKYIPPRQGANDSERHTVVRAMELAIPEEDAEISVDCEWGDAVFMGPSNEIVACPADDRVYFWNRHSKECIHALSVGDGDEDDVPEFAWYVNGKALMMASASGKNGSMKLWKVGTRDGATGKNTPRQVRVSRPQTPSPPDCIPEAGEVLSSSPTEMTPPVFLGELHEDTR